MKTVCFFKSAFRAVSATMICLTADGSLPAYGETIYRPANWVNDPFALSTNVVLEDADTTHPVYSDDGLGFGTGVLGNSPIGTTLTLSQPGDTITFQGQVKLAGYVSTDGGNWQFRLGLLYKGTNSTDINWLGYVVGNPVWDPASDNYALLLRNNPNNGRYGSLVGTTEPVPDSFLYVPSWGSGQYEFSLSIRLLTPTQTAVEWSLVGVSPNTYLYSGLYTNSDVSGTGGFIFDQVGFLGGSGLFTAASTANVIAFTNLQVVASISEPRSPTVTINPSSQTAQVGSNVTFTVSASGTPLLNYQWRFNGQNIPNATNATFALNSVRAANSGAYSVVVSNPYGSVTSATAFLAVLDDGANGNTPAQITAPTIPPKPPSKDSLVVITHGWEPLQPNADLRWMVAMSNAIQSRCASNWVITNYVWLQDAIYANPELVLAAAEIHGRLYGQQLANQGWSHIHFIGHSAGAGLIENAAAEIHFGATVQCTFLDPFVGLLLEKQSEYGVNADWADCYFTQDLTGGFTGGGLTHVYNVDVDWLDPNHDTLIYGSALIAVSELNIASHGYPIDFFTQSATNNPMWCPDAADYGFALSEEGGGETRWSNYPTGNGNDPYVLCGPPNAIPSPPLPVAIVGVTIDQVSHAVSDTFLAVVNGAGFLLNSIWSSLPLVKSGGVQPMGETSTNTPAWLAVGMSATNAINFVQFDATFTDTNSAQGLLTVYWNTNQIGMVDERVAEMNLHTYRFGLPATVTSGLYTLSFRLDSFNNSSSLAVTNVATGFVGVTQPINLGISFTNGAPMLQLIAATNLVYLIQSSTNLVDWVPTALLLNTNGTAQFIDSAVTNSGVRFYRAVLP